jgi:Fe-S-cluster containining protein
MEYGFKAFARNLSRHRRRLHHRHHTLTLANRYFQTSSPLASPTATPDKAWFELNESSKNKSPVHFECTACGKCCTGKGGKVWVNTAEQNEISDLLNLSRKELIESYLDVGDKKGKYGIQQVQKEGEERCIFLTTENKCSIYRVRPTQCRTFPYWPQIMASHYDWQRSQQQCEGIRLPVLKDEDQKHDDDDKDSTFPLSPIPTTTIWNNLLVHTVHRAGIEDTTIPEEEQESHMTYTQMTESLSHLDSAMLQDFQQDYLQQHQRQIVYESQDLWVVDTLGSGWQSQSQSQHQPTRSLIFRNAPSLTQSEMKLVRSTSSVDGDDHAASDIAIAPAAGSWQVDHTTLLLDVHQVMARIARGWDAQVRLLPNNSDELGRHLHLAVLGTGAGALPLWLHGKYPQATIDCVEASPEVLQVAQDYFGFNINKDQKDNDRQNSTSGTLRSYCQRGEDYLAEDDSSGLLLDLLLIDVAAGTEIPPRNFFEPDLLQRIQNRLVPQHGMLVWNVQASSSHEFEWERILATLRETFPHVHVQPVSPTSANRIVYASNDPNFLEDPILFD